MVFYTSKCELCGEEVGPPDERDFLAFADLTIYPGGKWKEGKDTQGVRVVKKVEEGVEAENVADVSVHWGCWEAWIGGVLAGKRFYRADE